MINIPESKREDLLKDLKKIKLDKLHFILNESEKAAYVNGHDSLTNVFIPRSIQHENQEYIVTRILKGAFEDSLKVKSIQFPSNSEIQIIESYAFSRTSIKQITIPKHVTKICECSFYMCKHLKQVDFLSDSELQIIEADSFRGSTIECLTIPSKVCELKKGWCNGSSKLTSVIVVPSNRNFINLDNKMIVGKSDMKSDNYNVLIFYRRDLNTVTIPSFIEQISSYAFSNSLIEYILIPSNVTQICEFAFQNCTKLKNIEFQENSKLEIIYDHAFTHTSIKNILIPSHVTKIGELAFSSCEKLQKVEISNNSELEIIEKNAFADSTIESLIIPSSILELKEGWCNGAINLSEVKIFQNKQQNIKLFNDMLIIGKSDLKNEGFDVLLFAKRSIKSVSIPSFIKIIAPYSFADSSIEKVLISNHVKTIEKNAFYLCYNLSKFVIPYESQLQTIEKFSFIFTSIKSLFIPSSVTKLGEKIFNENNKLQIIEIAENSQLKLLDVNIFGIKKSNFSLIMISIDINIDFIY